MEKSGNEIENLETILNSRITAHQNFSVQFALVLVANLMLVNSGALFYFPSYLQKSEHLSSSTTSVIYAATCFVSGIVLATICGYSAYHNFMAHAGHEASTRRVDIVRRKHSHEEMNSEAWVNWFADLKAQVSHAEMVITFTLWSGNIAGIFSLVAFVLGCYFARIAILT